MRDLFRSARPAACGRLVVAGDVGSVGEEQGQRIRDGVALGGIMGCGAALDVASSLGPLPRPALLQGFECLQSEGHVARGFGF